MATVVRSTPEGFSQSHLLRHFVPNNRHLFPIQVKVLEYDDPVTVLDRHQVEIGSQLVLHGWTRQPKVLATSGLNRYAIPLSYQGTFRVIARSFKGQSGLEHSFQKGQKLKVVQANPDPNDGVLPVREGDVILALGESVQDQSGTSYIDCRKIDQHSGRTSDVFMSSSWDITFEEILENLPPGAEGGGGGGASGMFSIRDFVAMLSERSFDVELIRKGTDHLDPTEDLPTNTPINLCKHIVEPAVYASLGTPLTPSFHIPMRSPIYVRFLRQLPKSCSPWLTKQNARVSTFDRCVELLTPEAFHEVIVNHRRIMQLLQQTPSNGTMTLPSARSRGKRGLSSSQSQVDLREMSSNRKGPKSTTGSLSSRFKWQFSLGRKGKRSTGGSSRGGGSDFGSIRSLPLASRKKSNRFKFLLSNGDSLDTGSPNRNQANQRDFIFLPTNRIRPKSANHNQGSDAGLINRPMPSVTARLSQRKSTNKKHLMKTTIYEEVGGEETEEEIPGNILSTHELSPHVKPRFRTNEGQEERTNQIVMDNISTNQTIPRENRANQISVQTPNGNFTERVQIHQEVRTNHTTDRPPSANQRVTTDYDAPRPRTNHQQLSVTGNDVTSKGIRRQSSLSSDARSPSVSDSFSSADGSPLSPGFRLNGSGSVLSNGSNTSILKTTTTTMATNNNRHLSSSNHQLPHLPPHSPTFQIPPGFALVPLNPNQTAIPPGFALVPATDMQPQLQQKQQPSAKQQLLSSVVVQQQQLQQQQQPSSHQQRQLQHDYIPHLQDGYNAQQSKTNTLTSRRPSQVPSDADTLREVSLDEGEDGFCSEDGSFNSVSHSNNGRMAIPLDGNLVSFSVKNFTQFLLCFNIDDSVIESCRRHRIDGKRFARMTEVDLEKRGILHPVVMYFRKRTGKRKINAVPM